MGTFASLWRDKGSKIPEEKRKEFLSRIEKLFQEGGMMTKDLVSLYGKSIMLLDKPKMGKTGFNVYYNYYEGSNWEDAGFNHEEFHVYSNKIGWSKFNSVVLAAYALEELYTEGATLTEENEVVEGGACVGWINYLFGEKYNKKNFDLWDSFEAIHYYEPGQWEFCPKDFRISYDNKRVGDSLLSAFETYAVKFGLEKAVEWFDNFTGYGTEAYKLDVFITHVRKFVGYIPTIKEKWGDETDSKVEQLMHIVENTFSEDDQARHGVFDAMDKMFEEYKDDKFSPFLVLLKSPQTIVLTLAEISGKDFWELWDRVHGKSKRYISDKGDYYMVKLPTHEFLNISQDEMVINWYEGCDIEFSEEMHNWFDFLKKEFDRTLEMEDTAHGSFIRYMVTLLESACDYYQAYGFNSFFEETPENLGDAKFRALWRLAGRIMKGFGVTSLDEFYQDEAAEGVVLHDRYGDLSQKETMKRYLALIANKDLRKHVFGF